MSVGTKGTKNETPAKYSDFTVTLVKLTVICLVFRINQYHYVVLYFQVMWKIFLKLLQALKNADNLIRQ